MKKRNQKPEKLRQEEIDAGASIKYDEYGESYIIIKQTIVRHSRSNFPSKLNKYWHQRHRLFKYFDRGIWLDEESWYSVTPEPLGRQIATHLSKMHDRNFVVIDGFCGAGGNAIQFALIDKIAVIAIDDDPIKLICAKHNARIYNVEHKIIWILADFFNISKKIKGDIIFLSPPWGGPDYQNSEVFNIEAMKPYPASLLFHAANHMVNNSNKIVMYLPRTSSLASITSLIRCPHKVEAHYLKASGKTKAICCYFGPLAQ
ncbi:hypothetical protein T552_02929 [Pneumocystis carinii B80]|uniref:Trimethylguanosine synthase n=1 Tax=Pneumocystis carinii (strain B80) TaxID=1408658 RepID=A0A0W4ZDH7_PNEC8|nr:hypothetical protein T552_02929 [Pneumocystis carinii B80]KTW26450.1 hypothetical protein T552_02929 [Pneumocystis carinii B80]